MKRNILGKSGIEVSQYCLGSMTWGTQNTAEEAHAQIETALAAGVNFIDTAEMYPVNPVSAHTIGRTERIIGLWLDHNSARRGDLVLATKHSGEGMQHVRDGAPISAATIREAIEGSLRRLQTDYIDLYQFHWPNRGSYMFRKNWAFDPSGQLLIDTQAHMEEALEALEQEVRRGTIRAFGLSNESAWGLTRWVQTAQRLGGLPVASIQNEYSLLCRLFDTDLAEASLQEDVPLLAFSPLAAGLLTGKYQDGAVPQGSRMSLVADLGGRRTERAFEAVAAYEQIARAHGLNPAQMALAWCAQRPFVGSVIFGATTAAQLDLALGAAQLCPGPEVIAEIDAVHRAHPMPY